MAQYTEDFLAAARHGYEHTDQPMRELARELGIGLTTLSTLAETHGWAKRSQRKRGLPPAMQLLAEAQALAVTLPPQSGGEGRRAPEGASRGGGLMLDRTVPPTHSRCSASAFLLEENGGQRPPMPSPPLAEPVIGPAQEGRTRWLAEGGEQIADDAAEPPPTLLDRMEQILEQLIAAEEAAPANGIRSPQSARNLTTLIQAMRALKGMRGHASTNTGPIENDDDDMPRDIDEFRRDLARRIDAFVASETDAEDADENSGAGAVDAVG